MSRIGLKSPDTEYPPGMLVLKERRYHKQPNGWAKLVDDGIIDHVAIDRAMTGRTEGLRLTPREVVCVVARAARDGRNDTVIAAMFGNNERAGVARVQAIRKRNRIQAAEPSFDENYLSSLILSDSQWVGDKSESARRAAGLAA